MELIHDQPSNTLASSSMQNDNVVVIIIFFLFMLQKGLNCTRSYQVNFLFQFSVLLIVLPPDQFRKATVMSDGIIEFIYSRCTKLFPMHATKIPFWKDVSIMQTWEVCYRQKHVSTTSKKWCSHLPWKMLPLHTKMYQLLWKISLTK